MNNHIANGRYGEIAVMKWLRDNGYRFEDVSNDKDFFDCDVDLLVYSKSG